MFGINEHTSLTCQLHYWFDRFFMFHPVFTESWNTLEVVNIDSWQPLCVVMDISFRHFLRNSWKKKYSSVNVLKSSSRSNLPICVKTFRAVSAKLMNSSFKNLINFLYPNNWILNKYLYLLLTTIFYVSLGVNIKVY